MICKDFYLGTYLCLKYSEKISNIVFLNMYLCLKYSEEISDRLGQEASKLLVS